MCLINVLNKLIPDETKIIHNDRYRIKAVEMQIANYFLNR